MIAPYVATVASSISTILGGALIGQAWSGEAPKRSAVFVGLGLLSIGAVIAYQQIEHRGAR
jgi:hypothetical protein